MLAYVDASVWIARAEGCTEFRDIIKSRLRELKQEGWCFCTSKAVMMETLYKPYRDKDQLLVTAYAKMFSNTKMLPNYQNLFTDALRTMQTETLKAMDSIHVAIAIHYGCDGFISTDSDFRKLHSIRPFWIDLSLSS